MLLILFDAVHYLPPFPITVQTLYRSSRDIQNSPASLAMFLSQNPVSYSYNGIGFFTKLFQHSRALLPNHKTLSCQLLQKHSPSIRSLSAAHLQRHHCRTVAVLCLVVPSNLADHILPCCFFFLPCWVFSPSSWPCACKVASS